VGEHTRYIFREVLGLADAEADTLEREKALYWAANSRDLGFLVSSPLMTQRMVCQMTPNLDNKSR